MKIFLNAGHGGSDCGAVSKNGLKEKDVCKKICDILAEILRKNGHFVIVYQELKSYFEITQQENKSGADLFISVHCNSFASQTVHGIETLYYPTSTNGRRLADNVQKALVKLTGLHNRGIKARNDLHVLKRTKSPAILVECAFISNPSEEILLRDKPKLFADGIAQGIKNYIG